MVDAYDKGGGKRYTRYEMGGYVTTNSYATIFATGQLDFRGFTKAILQLHNNTAYSTGAPTEKANYVIEGSNSYDITSNAPANWYPLTEDIISGNQDITYTLTDAWPFLRVRAKSYVSGNSVNLSAAVTFKNEVP